ncbi:MAG TPA: hypothetical protein VGI36_17925 [Candidatus Binataceae bacterium]
MPQIELACPLIFGVNGYDRRRNFTRIRQYTLECIEQQQFANVAAAEVLLTADLLSRVAGTFGYRGSFFATLSGRSLRLMTWAESV